MPFPLAGTREVEVDLYKDHFRVQLSPAAAASLDGHTEYVVHFAINAEALREVDAALGVIYAGGNRVQYRKHF